MRTFVFLILMVAVFACDEDADPGLYRLNPLDDPAMCGTFPDGWGTPAFVTYRDPADGCKETELGFLGCAALVSPPGAIGSAPGAGVCAVDPVHGYTYCAVGAPFVGGTAAWIGHMVERGELLPASFIPFLNEDRMGPYPAVVTQCWPEAPLDARFYTE